MFWTIAHVCRRAVVICISGAVVLRRVQAFAPASFSVAVFGKKKEIDRNDSGATVQFCSIAVNASKLDFVTDAVLWSAECNTL